MSDNASQTKRREKNLAEIEESSVSSRDSQTSRPLTRKRKSQLQSKTYSSGENDEIEIISLQDISDEECNKQRKRSCKQRKRKKTEVSEDTDTQTQTNGKTTQSTEPGKWCRLSRSSANSQHTTAQTNTNLESNVTINLSNWNQSKATSSSSVARTLCVDTLTPNSLSHYSHRSSPLPNFSWADSTEIWDLMLHKDTVYQRNALLLHRHPTLQARMRSILIDWLSEVCEVYRLHRDTYYLSVDFIDRYLSYQTDIPKQQLQLLGITCLFIASKIEEIYPPKINEFSYVTDGACNESEIITKELVILKALNWDLCPMTINSWLTVYMQIYATLEKENSTVRSNRNQDGDSFLIPEYESNLFAQVAHLVDLCILDIGSLTYTYSIIAASALYHFTNEATVRQCTGLPLSDIRECVVWMIPFALAIRDEGFDNPKLQQKIDETNANLNNIQSHTVDLQLLEKAHIKQLEREIEGNSESEESPSPISSPIATRADILTPPKSNSKVRH